MRFMIKSRWELQKLFIFLQLILCPAASIYFLSLRDWDSMPATWIFSIALNLFGMFICIFLFMSVVKDRSDITFRTGYFSYLIGICDFELFLSLVTWLMDDVASFHILNAIANTASAALSTIMLRVAWFYLVEVADLDTPILHKISRFVNVIAAISFTLYIVNYFGHYYFYVDSNGLYHRGPYFITTYVFTAIMFICIIGISIFMDVSSTKKNALISFAAIPIVAVIVQALTFGISLTYPAFLLSLIFIYGNVFAEQNHELTQNRLKAITAENKLLLEQQKHERIKTELNMATEIQTKTLPTIFPPFPDAKGIDLYSVMHPAKEVGGDFYDFFKIDDDQIGLVIADVSGKGVPAALYMMIAKTLIKSAVKQGMSPAETLSYVNEQFYETSEELDMFVTVWLGIFNLKTNLLTASNAGHEYPAIKRAGGSFEIYKDKHSFVVGGLENIHYKEYELSLHPGDTLFVYTDGVPEASDETDTLFGTNRMIEALNHNPELHSKELIAHVLQEIQFFIGTAEQFDDITMMALRIEEK
ncbi:MAG: PP2C family protein-serine/threonine phosphatase [Eubacteriales bacterium]|nr:PP2C family protein-serine/threonine phosphatase [Eubacteriales bacterium]